jgi:fructose-1,6-bisphosphatase/inositol monophosphatase family enzyme
MQFSEETEFIIKLINNSGEMARESFNPYGVGAYSRKSDDSPVTTTDIAINKMIIEEVQRSYPEWGVLGEEEQWNEQANTLLVVDPVDGTKPFIWGQATFGCMAALVVDGEVRAAVVSNPMMNRTVVAEKGAGAWLYESGTQLQVNKATSLEHEVVYLHSKSILCVDSIIQQGGGFVASSSVAEIAAMTAKGAWAGAVLNLPGAHDIASAKLIVEEAGGKVTDLQGNDQRYDGLVNGAIISNGRVHDILVEIYQSKQSE